MGKDDDFGRLVSDVASRINDSEACKRGVGISSGYKSLDSLIGGFREGSLSVVAARPCVGKTAFELSVAINMAFGENPIPVGFFSFELSGSSVVERIISNKAEINLLNMKEGILGSEERIRIMNTADYLYNNSGSFILRDSTGLSLEEISVQIRDMADNNGVKAVFIDNISLLGQENFALSRFDRSIDACRTLKRLADELGIPIVCGCSIRKNTGHYRPPLLSDLHDSGLVDQYADLVIFLDYNPELEDSDDFTGGDDGDTYPSGNSRRTRVIVAKNRDGKSGAFFVDFDYLRCRFNETKPIVF